MYILPHWCFLDQNFKVLWIFKVLKFHIFQGMNVFLMWLICLYPLNYFSHHVFYYMSPFDSPLQNWLLSNMLMFTFEGPKSKLKLKFSSNRFLVWILWHSYEWKAITCHDYHGFKWKNINIDPILTIFLCDWMSFLARWIVTIPYSFH